MCTNTKLVFTDRVTFYCAIIFIFLNGHTEQFSDRMAMKPKMDTVCTLLGFVGRGLPVFPMPSRCFPMPSRCLPDAFRCLPDARCFPMPSRRLTDAFRCFPDCFPMPSRCLPMPVSSAFPIPSRCLADPFPILYLSNPFLTPLHESLPNYFSFQHPPASR